MSITDPTAPGGPEDLIRRALADLARIAPQADSNISIRDGAVATIEREVAYLVSMLILAEEALKCAQARADTRLRRSTIAVMIAVIGSPSLPDLDPETVAWLYSGTT